MVFVGGLRFEYRNAVVDEARMIYPGNLARQAMYMDLHNHLVSILDRNDRMTMGASIECREPFMDYRLMEMIPALPERYLLPGKKGKRLLLESVGKHLPEQVRNFRKIGLSVPWSSYLKNDKGAMGDMYHHMTKGFVAELLPSLDIKAQMASFENGDPTAQALMPQLFVLEIWGKVFSQIRQQANN